MLLSEFDPLRQRQFLRPVDGVGLAPHVSLPGVGARLAPAARLFFAAERAADLRARRADVDVGYAAIRTGRGEKGLRLAQRVGKDGAG